MPELLLGDAPIEDDPPPGGGRPRWVDALGLVAVVGAIVAFGVLGDPGPREEASTPATTTTTTRPPRRVPYRRLPTTTTSTTLPLGTPVEVGELLPVETDTVLLLSTTSGMQLLDVDGRTIRRVGEFDFPMRSFDDGFLVSEQGRLGILPVAGGPVRDLGVSESGQAVAIGDRLWLWNDTVAEEVDLAGGATGRQVDLPPSAYLAGAVPGYLVVGQHGSITLIDVDDGRARSLGHGSVLAVQGDRVLAVSCEALRCTVTVHDTRTGRRRELAGGDGVVGDWGTLSDDGRWFASVSHGPASGNGIRLLDLESGATRMIELVAVQGVAFSVNGGQLFAASGRGFHAIDLASGATHELVLRGVSGVHGLLAAPAP